jgi:hypothetical protein
VITSAGRDRIGADHVLAGREHAEDGERQAELGDRAERGEHRRAAAHVGLLAHDVGLLLEEVACVGSRAAARPRLRTGKVRWVVERTFSWLDSFRRLRIRYERSGALHTAFLSFPAAVICQRLLP